MNANRAELVAVFHSIPSHDQLSAALVATPFTMRRGRRVYDVVEAGEALAAYYRRLADSAIAKHSQPKHSKDYKGETAKYAEMWTERAAEIDRITEALRH